MIAEDGIDEEGTAYHEAGHVVVGAARGRPPISATITPEGTGAVGKTEFPKDWPPEYKTHFGDSAKKRTYIETRILISVAGTIAQDMRFLNRVHDAADATDDRISREIVEDTHALIHEYVEAAGHGNDDNGALFRPLRNNATGDLDRALTPDGVYKLVRAYSTSLGFRIGAHALRATAATNALDHEADIAKVQEWLGHANIATTRIYDHRHHGPEGSPPFKVSY